MEKTTSKLQCSYTECIYSKECGFLEITKKIPKDKNKCSWYTTNPKNIIKTNKQLKKEEKEDGNTDSKSS